MREDANRARRHERREAEAEARRHLGSPLRAREGMREARVIGWIESLGRDLRHGARMFRRQPGLAALAILTLSLGIGANAAIFSLLNAVLLRPLPFPDADRLVAVDGQLPRRPAPPTSAPPSRSCSTSASRSALSTAMSFYDTRDFQMTGGDEPVRVFAARVEASFLTLLGVRPALGRLFVDGRRPSGARSRRRAERRLLAPELRRRPGGRRPRADRQRRGRTPSSACCRPSFRFDYWSAEPIEMYVPFPMNPIYTRAAASSPMCGGSSPWRG